METPFGHAAHRAVAPKVVQKCRLGGIADQGRSERNRPLLAAAHDERIARLLAGGRDRQRTAGRAGRVQRKTERAGERHSRPRESRPPDRRRERTRGRER